MDGMEDLSRHVEGFPSTVESFLQRRVALRRRQAEAIAASDRIASYAASLGPQHTPPGAPSPGHASELSEGARRALDGVRAEAAAVTALIDEVASRRAAVAQLGKALESARTTRKVLVGGGAAVAAILLLILAASC
jgi:hypothetical protein